MPIHQSKVAITQPGIIYGGRISVLLGITEALNSLNITPVWLSGTFPGSKEEILGKYNSTAAFTAVQLARPFLRKLIGRFPGEWSIRQFNASVTKFCEKEGITTLINSSNTLQGFAGPTKILSYVHYPREARAISGYVDIHDPSKNGVSAPLALISQRLCRLNYCLGRDFSPQRIICNSIFTRDALLDYYRNRLSCQDIEVVYPFCSGPLTPKRVRREPAIATLGRFCPAKGQKEQIRLAASLDGIEMWIMGYADSRASYFREYLRDADHSSVKIHTLVNASYSHVMQRLQRCRYFLHTSVNEPFGITSVEAIANGAIPIVHDSGGQIETVNIPFLRYSNLREVPAIIRRLEADECLRKEVRAKLRSRVKNLFLKNVFVERFRDILRDELTHV